MLNVLLTFNPCYFISAVIEIITIQAGGGGLIVMFLMYELSL